MEFKLTIDFSDHAVQALAAIAEALKLSCVKSAQPEIAQNAPETRLDVQPAPVQAETENVQPVATQPQDEAISPEPTETAEPVQEAPKTEPVKKPKKKAVKKAPESPQNAPEPEPAPVQAETENVQPAVAQPQDKAISPEPAEAQEDIKTEKAEDDPMQGMSVMRAMQVLLDEIDEKGIDMADVNARIRAKAQELNLSYPSGTILMKAIGYVETRKIALGL
jgi:outer membrane biosynthesis protein TonB